MEASIKNEKYGVQTLVYQSLKNPGFKPKRGLVTDFCYIHDCIFDSHYNKNNLLCFIYKLSVYWNIYNDLNYMYVLMLKL